jgi:two-component system sensor histidine kinase KdpD
VRLSLARIHLAEAARLAEGAAEAERTRSTLLAAMGHDLRTPLATMGAAAATLVDHGDRLPVEERAELTRMVHGGTQRLTELVEGLLEYTRLEGGALHLKGEWLPMEEILGVVLTRLEQAQRTLPVELDLPPGLPLVFGDGLLLEELLTNLLANALRYAPGSPVTIGATLSPGRFLLTVTDRGPGIPIEARDRVFGKFERLAEGPGQADGLGLGLAICRAIVDVHGGRIWVEDGPEGGARFCVDLPQPPLPDDLGD